MKIFHKVEEITNDLRGRKVGFVPTMGALHEGHLSLIKRAQSDQLETCVSIFVNPTQFNNSDDLQKYPKTLELDIEKLKSEQTEFLFLPSFEEMYPDGYNYQVLENNFSKTLCGASRPGHFEGMLTVVMKLLNIVKPRAAYFGEKDWQQTELVKGMVDAFFMDVQIEVCPTVRESDGLAMSSRNMRLTPEQRKLAPVFHQVLTQEKDPMKAKQRLQEVGFVVDYLEDLRELKRRVAAVYLGDIRLIDNVRI